MILSCPYNVRASAAAPHGRAWRRRLQALLASSLGRVRIERSGVERFRNHPEAGAFPTNAAPSGRPFSGSLLLMRQSCQRSQSSSSMPNSALAAAIAALKVGYQRL